MEFNVESVSEIVWNDEAFTNLVLPTDRKTLLRSLVEVHNNHFDFDDFVKGKGHGLVVNLFGPPGVGKTLSAEATSEHVRRPLYVIGGGDLGTDAAGLDKALQEVFDIATGWQAIVLIDEVSKLLPFLNPSAKTNLPSRPTSSSSNVRCMTSSGTQWWPSCKRLLATTSALLTTPL